MPFGICAAGLLLINRGNWVRVGVVLSILFNLFLVQMGLGYPAPGALTGFLVNRLPNIGFILLQVPLLFAIISQTLPEELIKHRSTPKSRSA